MTLTNTTPATEGAEALDLAILDADVDPATLAAAYAQGGAVHLRGVLRDEEVAELREAFTSHIETDGTGGAFHEIPEGDPLRAYPRMIQPHRGDHEPGRMARRWLLEQRVMGRVAEAVGPVWAAQSMFYFKPAGARGQAMHQDNYFLQTHPETCIAAWIAVDDCDGENGALGVVPGTHRYEIECPEEADPAESFTTITVAIPEHLRVVQTDMRAGDMLIFHGSLVHGSQPNTSTDRYRRSLILHYIPEGSREVAASYQPLLDAHGDEVRIEESEYGGQCGEGWVAINH
ncbi:phytanoyl-CoA dioxygenase family protein [Brachybacterium saurashtrense]|uniref:Phytanoyl-CoA dioxygenase family protein n=1 Tax=Brachybacterium saurashtrense TaxID=556288 RepID=A0A345YQU7_9MICO|nr:phytanoyl-CoA dioxygenase family protein [Brachybacterium saurashtrense]AXK46299.1 phytanoyl-CoA dioxygenase family protein [Brachybacterium saurashtrense]RRR24039.1 phytanoyl-CoA dioxygenase family protein [Brachybacterium saurashtrense]